MLEIEVKYLPTDIPMLRARLAALQATPQAPRTEADRYFNAPDRDFAVTGEAFRLRQVGDQNLVTWKGPKLDRQTKTREEIEIPFAAGPEPAADLAKLLTRLGYREVGAVRKQREVFALSRDGFAATVSIDTVEGLGVFAEVEIVAAPAEFERAKAVVLALAGEVGLEQVEPRSYLTMKLAAVASR
jgi:adenylate cyclase class 2